MRKLTFTQRLLIAVLVLLQTILSASVFLTLREPDPFQGSAVIDPPFTPLTYSIHTFWWWDDGAVGTQLDWVEHLLGFTHVKHTFAWRNLEVRPGEWDFSQSDRIVNEVEARGIQLIARLGQVPDWATDSEVVNENSDSHDSPPNDLEVWANFCRTVAERYKGRIAAYQIWNEPNLAREWGFNEPNAVEYVEVLRACSEAIRAVDSEAILISAGLSPTGTYDTLAHPDDVYLNAMYRAGFQQYVDVVGVHTPGFAPPSYGPDDAEQDGKGRWASFRRIEDLRKIMVQHGDAARQMAIMEFGWTTDQRDSDYEWFAVTEEEQAQYIVEGYQYAAEHWRPWVGLMSLIYLHNPQWTENDEEWWWSLTAPNGYVRPAFYAIVSMDRYCGEVIIHGWEPGVQEEVYREQSIACP